MKQGDMVKIKDSIHTGEIAHCDIIVSSYLVFIPDLSFVQFPDSLPGKVGFFVSPSYQNLYGLPLNCISKYTFCFDANEIEEIKEWDPGSSWNGWVIKDAI